MLRTTDWCWRCPLSCPHFVGGGCNKGRGDDRILCGNNISGRVNWGKPTEEIDRSLPLGTGWMGIWGDPEDLVSMGTQGHCTLLESTSHWPCFSLNFTSLPRSQPSILKLLPWSLLWCWSEADHFPLFGLWKWTFSLQVSVFLQCVLMLSEELVSHRNKRKRKHACHEAVCECSSKNPLGLPNPWLIINSRRATWTSHVLSCSHASHDSKGASVFYATNNYTSKHWFFKLKTISWIKSYDIIVTFIWKLKNSSLILIIATWVTGLAFFK